MIINGFSEDVPNNLQEYVESVYQDTLELNQEHFSQKSLEQDLNEFYQIQENLQAPLQSNKKASLYSYIITILKQASDGHIDHYRDKLGFIKMNILNMLQNNSDFIYLFYILDFHEYKSNTKTDKGIQYLIKLFQQQNYQNHLQQSIQQSNSIVSTQLSYHQTQVYSKFEKPFYQFITGQIIQNDKNFSTYEQNLIICLNELTKNNYKLSQESYEKLVQSHSGNMNKSLSQFNQEEDLYYQILNNFLQGEDFSQTRMESIIRRDSQSIITTTPFIIQVFFKLIINQNNELFGRSLYQSKQKSLKDIPLSTVQRNSDLLILMLESQLDKVYEYMQSHGMFIEMFLMGFFMQQEIVNIFYLPQQIGEIDMQLLKDVVDDNLHFSINQSVMITSCYLQAIKLMKNDIIVNNVSNQIFSVFGDQQFSIIEDVISSYVCYLKFASNYQQIVSQSINDQLNVNQQYIFAILLILCNQNIHAYEVLSGLVGKIYDELYIRNQYDSNRQISQILAQISQQVIQYILITSQKIIIDLLFKPANIQEFQRQMIELNDQLVVIYQNQNDHINMQQHKLNLQLIDLIILYHSNSSSGIKQNCQKTLQQLIELNNTVGLSLVYQEHINEILHFLLLVCIKYKIDGRQIKSLAGFFQSQLTEENRSLIQQLR